ncbi:carboxypeptidase A2-like isoform X2 [Mizuhopecten yessoensis]|uniref:carboxypeptidase A2-like isoform X2 n=1 Tax=Mizuhopecten yessoensis TaxID=6573 RepID=UPI000B45F483|nr:carboxypeptidase A2-like isoform X2 [Mizuhopecten yessoensis]
MAPHKIFFIVLLHLIINLLVDNIVKGIDVKPQKEIYLPNYNFYHNISSLENKINEIVQRNTNYMRIDTNYRSRLGRSQLVIHITNFTGSTSTQLFKNTMTPKLKVLLSFGEHAREFLPVESMLFFLSNLTAGLSSVPGSYAEQFTRSILSKVDLFIIGMANPDGRTLLEQKSNYCWRGTSTGVDLDRNFDWEFGGKGSSSDPYDEEYRGEQPFSEPEGKVFRELTLKYTFDAFVSFHSGINQIYLPYADTKSKLEKRRPYNVEDMLDLASELSHATKRGYTYGHSYALNHYTADGTIFDFMSGSRMIPFSFAIELWPWKQPPRGKSCFNLFNPRSEQLEMYLKRVNKQCRGTGIPK